MNKLCLLIVLLGVTACLAREHHQSPIPKGWVEQGVPAADADITLLFALKQKNMDVLESTLLTIADPRSSTYGQWLSHEEITQLIAPSQLEIEIVTNWLERNRIHEYEVSLGKDWIRVSTTVRDAERLLQCKIVTYYREATQQLVYRAKEIYVIPHFVEHVIDFVAGLHGFPFTSWEPKLVPVERRVASIGNTPSSLASLYQITIPNSPCTKCNTSQAVVEFSGANYSPSDLQTFFKQYSPNLVGQTVTNVYGNNNPSGHISVEANLDVQYVMAIGAFVDTADYVEKPTLSILDAFLNYQYVVGNQTNPPLAHSISYGQYGGQYDNSTVQRINSEFIKMGARGITVSVASGDNGVGCGDRCQSQEFDFPSSPYVTLVGATDVSTGTETGAHLSSGGFSRDYYRPAWQQQQVEGYLNSNVALPPLSSYDPNGRGYPDVASVGVSIDVIVNGRTEPVDGTSCAAPVFTGIISLLNAQRTAAGKTPLGWINPWVYQNPQMFNDITSGENSYRCCKGFQASQGWDPITGMGSPNYPAMLAAALALP